jgi:hypothetical protein
MFISSPIPRFHRFEILTTKFIKFFSKCTKRVLELELYIAPKPEGLNNNSRRRSLWPIHNPRINPQRGCTILILFGIKSPNFYKFLPVPRFCGFTILQFDNQTIIPPEPLSFLQQFFKLNQPSKPSVAFFPNLSYLLNNG